MDNNQIVIVRDNWESWRQDPVTNLLIDCIKKHREAFVESSSASAANMNMPSETFRNLAMGVRTTDAILSLMTNFEILTKQITAKQNK